MRASCEAGPCSKDSSGFVRSRSSRRPGRSAQQRGHVERPGRAPGRRSRSRPRSGATESTGRAPRGGRVPRPDVTTSAPSASTRSVPWSSLPPRRTRILSGATRSAESGRVPNSSSNAARAIRLTVGPSMSIVVRARLGRPRDPDPDEGRIAARDRQLDVAELAVGRGRRPGEEIDAVEAHRHRSGPEVHPSERRSPRSRPGRPDRGPARAAGPR